jgi:hypothetical protein
MHLSNAAHELSPPAVLGSEGWVRWVSEISGLTSEFVSYSSPGKDIPRLEGTVFFDAKGRFRQPKFGPYLALSYTPGAAAQTERRYRQWVSVAELFASDIVERGLAGSIALPPGMLDARPFQWAGLNVQLRYTFAAPLPVNSEQFQPDIRRRVRRATEAGYVAERSTDWAGIMDCLLDTEEAQDFKHDLTVESLRSAHRSMGDESFRGYVVRDPDGTAVSGGVRLHEPGTTAINWLQGTRRSHLSEGVTQLMYSFVLDDLAAAGASDFDYVGANIKSVAAAKAGWGLPLVPYLLVGSFDTRNAYGVARSTKRWATRARHRS